MQDNAIGRPMEILLIEDSLDDAHLAFDAFKRGRVEHRLTWLRDGDEALAFLFRQGRFRRAPRPDLILLDLSLPKTDGREVLTEIKFDFELREIPVVIMTASEAHEDVVRSEMLQVESYMIKPVDLQKFLRVVSDLRDFWRTDLLLPQTD